MSSCVVPDHAELVIHVAGSVVAGQQIAWQTMTRELAATRACEFGPGKRVKLSSDLVVVSRGGAVPPLEDGSIPDGRVPSTLRHLPWLKLRVAACGDDTVRPIWLDLGQSIVLPASAASAALVGHRTFFEVNSSNQGADVPPASQEQSTLDAWIYIRVEETTCCEPYDVLLTDSAIVPATGDGSVTLNVPPRARCLTIHKGTGSAVGVEWVLDESNLIVGTAGMPAASSQLVLTVPEALRLRLSSADQAEQVVLVWGLHA